MDLRYYRRFKKGRLLVKKEEPAFFSYHVLIGTCQSGGEASLLGGFGLAFKNMVYCTTNLNNLGFSFPLDKVSIYMPLASPSIDIVCLK